MIEQRPDSLSQQTTNQSASGRIHLLHKITQGDLDILCLVLCHRLVRRDQLRLLTERHPKRLHRRLLVLGRNGYLTVIRQPPHAHIYGLAKGALPVLAEEGIASPDLVNHRFRTTELKPLFLKHEMMIVDVHVAITLACRAKNVALIDWQ